MSMETITLIAMSFLVLSGIGILIHRARGRRRDIERAEARGDTESSSDSSES